MAVDTTTRRPRNHSRADLSHCSEHACKPRPQATSRPRIHRRSPALEKHRSDGFESGRCSRVRQCRGGDDFLQGGDMAGEGVSPTLGQVSADLAAAAVQPTFGGDVAGRLQGRELLGQGRIRQPQAAFEEGELRPVGSSSVATSAGSAAPAAPPRALMCCGLACAGRRVIRAASTVLAPEFLISGSVQLHTLAKRFTRHWSGTRNRAPGSH